MNRADILYKYIEKKEQEKNRLLKQIQEYSKDMEEVAELLNILRKNQLKSYFQPEDSKFCYINWIYNNEKNNEFRMFLTDNTLLLFSIDTKGKYMFRRKSNGNLMHPSIETEIEYFSAFYEYFPKYRDSVFKYIEENFKIN